MRKNYYSTILRVKLTFPPLTQTWGEGKMCEQHVWRNETDAAKENIRGIESARLTTDVKMSIKAKRRL